MISRHLLFVATDGIGRMPTLLPHLVTRIVPAGSEFGIRTLVERQPDDLAGTVAAVAVSRLGEGVGKLPFLLLIAPLGGSVGDDVVGAAVGADRRGPGGRYGSPVSLLRRLLPGVKRIEK
jgi:hypothetical protein